MATRFSQRRLEARLNRAMPLEPLRGGSLQPQPRRGALDGFVGDLGDGISPKLLLIPLVLLLALLASIERGRSVRLRQQERWRAAHPVYPHGQQSQMQRQRPAPYPTPWQMPQVRGYLQRIGQHIGMLDRQKDGG